MLTLALKGVRHNVGRYVATLIAIMTGVAFFTDSWALGQLWLFWLAPVLGAVLAGATYALITGEHAVVKPRK